MESTASVLPCTTPPVPTTFTAQNRFKPFTHVKFTADVAKFSISAIGLIDSGSNVNLIPANLLTPEFLKTLPPSSTTVNGVGGANSMRGEFVADVTVGQARFDQVRFLVAPESKLPILLGNPLLKHETVTKYEVDRDAKKIVFTRNVDNRQLRQVVATLEENVAPGPVEISPRPGQCLSVEKLTPPPLVELREKLDWLKTKIGIQLEHSNADELTAMADLLLKYVDIFGDESSLGRFPEMVDIPTAGAPIAGKQHPIAQAFEHCVDDEIARMEKNGIIERVTDTKGWLTPILIVRKKDGSPRMCCNFKATLNRRLVEEETYAQRSAEELFNQLEPNAKYFSSMDLTRGYWQLELTPEARPKTAFQWGNKKYQFRRLPFGLRTAGNIFCQAISKAFEAENFDPRHVVVYLDDVSVHSPNFQAFIDSHERIFGALRRFNLKLNARKCNFLKPEIEFLGRLISSKGMRPNPEYIEGMMGIEAPKNKNELRQLIGRLVWLKQFISSRMNESVRVNSFSHLMEPICECTRGSGVEWTPAADSALTRLKKKLSSSPFISLADPRLDYVLACDASDSALGAVLMQRAGENDYRVVATVSHTFTGCERRWAVCEKEAYAIVWSVRKLHFFLAGRPFVIHTDHRSLVYIDTVTFKNDKISRWQAELSQYCFTIQYIKGEENVWADWLSRGSATKRKREHGESDFKPKGKFMAIAGTPLRIYVPSWVQDLVKVSDQGVMQLKPVDNSDNLTNRAALMVQMSPAECTDVFQGPSSMLAKVDVPEDAPLFPHLSIAAAQKDDSFYMPIIRAICETKGNKADIEAAIRKAIKPDDNRATKMLRLVSRLVVDHGTGVLYLEGRDGPRVVLPDSLIAGYLQSAHASMGHPGAERTLGHLNTVWWNGMADDVKQYVASCRLCAARKGTMGARAVPAGVNAKGNYPMHTLYLDFIVLNKAKNGLRYALTIIDSFSRYIEAFATRGCSAEDAARGLTSFIARHGGPPRVISSDRGVHFTAELFRRTCEALGIHHQLHTAWRPQSTSILERQHRTLKNSLYILSAERGLEWPQLLHLVCCAMNGMPNKSTRVSPFEVVTGRKYTLALPNFNATTAERPDQYAHKVNAELKGVYDAVRLCSQEADHNRQQKVNKNATRLPLRPGEHCLIYRPLSTNKENAAFDWWGDFIVLETNGLVSRVKCAKSARVDWVSNHHLKPLPQRDKRLRRLSNSSSVGPVVVDRGTTTTRVSTVKSEPGAVNGGAGVSSSTSPSSTPSTSVSSDGNTSMGRLGRFFSEMAKRRTRPPNWRKSGRGSSSSSPSTSKGARRPPPARPQPSTSTPIAAGSRRTPVRGSSKPYQHSGRRRSRRLFVLGSYWTAMCPLVHFF